MDDDDAKLFYEDESELLEDNEDRDEDTLGELAMETSDEVPYEIPLDAAPHCPHGLMDILLPAIPPRPLNARVIRRLKD
ncbi:MAG: hypothetical protein JWN13_4688 [Betaproteobacteria bacterium]|jgi:hypothetical protein|nr:hypothetical protein [Betaproteobacteria bacterium]